MMYCEDFVLILLSKQRKPFSKLGPKSKYHQFTIPFDEQTILERLLLEIGFLLKCHAKISTMHHSLPFLEYNLEKNVSQR
jgi:hypothetical protein